CDANFFDFESAFLTGRSVSTGARVSVVRERRWSFTPRRSHRSGGRSCAHGWIATGGSALRNFARRWHDGPAAGANGVPEKTRTAYLHDPKFDRAPAQKRETGRARAGSEVADRLRRFRFTFVSCHARWNASSRAGQRQDRQEQADAGARAQRMSHGRRVWIATVPLRQ